MSTLRTDNLTASNGVGGSIPMSFAVQGTAKAWFNLNGTGTIAARDDFNVSSYTDNGVGDYTATFSTARPNANYIMSPSVQTITTAQLASVGTFSLNNAGNLTASNPTTSAARMGTLSASNFTDASYALASIHGDPH